MLVRFFISLHSRVFCVVEMETVMSLKEKRCEFEGQFTLALKSEFYGMKNIKIKNNKLIIRDAGFVASVDYLYLNNLNAYGTIIVVRSPFLTAQVSEFQPPYKSNLPNPEYIYCMSSMGEKDGCPLLPTTQQGIDKTCDLFIDRLKDIHLPVIFNILDVSEKLIIDVVRTPKYYSYPFLIIMLAMRNNKISKESVDAQLIMGEQTLGFSNDKVVKMEFNNDVFRQY